MNLFDNINQLLYEALKYAIIVLIVVMIFAAIKSALQKRAKLGRLKLAKRKSACGIIMGMVMTLRGPRVVYSPINDEGSLLGWGTSGSGKTASILRPTLNSLKNIATTFAIDISGDIASTISLKNKIVFGPNAKNSAVYNVFAPADKIYFSKNYSEEEKRELTIEKLKKIALQMIPKLKKGEAADAVVYFNNGGSDILAASLIAGYFQKMDFADICVLINKSSWKKHFQWIDESGIEEAIDFLNQFEGEKEENTAGCMGNTKEAVLGIASTPSVRKFLHRPRKINGKAELYYTPSMLEKYSVFYVVNDGDDFDLHARLTRLVVSQTMDYLASRDMNKVKHVILLCLDEFSSLNMAKETTNAAKKYRKKKVRICIFTQSVADMDLMTAQGNTASRATIDNFPYRLVLGAQDPISQEYFAKCVGKHEVYKKTKSSGNNGDSSSYTPTREFWIQPEDFRKLDNDLVLIHPKGHMVLGKNYFHKSTVKIILSSILDFSIFKWGMH